jgi:hypothetical protein
MNNLQLSLFTDVCAEYPMIADALLKDSKEVDVLNLILKGTVAPIWVWVKVVWLERAKIGEGPLSVLKIFPSSFGVNRNTAP